MYQYQKDYPRPQLSRKSWENLNGEWDFAFDDKKEGITGRWQEDFPQGEKILVPFTYETKKSGIGRQEKHSRVWYERKLSLEKKEEKRYLLHFEGCDFYTKVWVNGELAGSHTGGYARFTFDVTELLIPGENRITVMAEDSYEIRQPRGKQRWRKENFGCWYVQTTGIWKTVWLEEVPELYISGLKITPLLKERAVEIDWEVGGDLEKLLEEGQKVFLNLEVGFQGRNISAVKIPVSRTHGRTRLDVFCD